MITKARILKTYYILTFIGTVFHELAHVKFARGRGLKIIEVSYFKIEDGKLGYVKHSPPKTYMDVFSVSVAPFLFNTGIAVLTLLCLFIYQTTVQRRTTVLIGLALFIGYWFSISLLLHAIPSTVDIKNTTGVIKKLWKDSIPDSVDRIKKWISDVHVIAQVILLPVSATVYTTQAVVFLLRHLVIIVTLPVISIVKLLNQTRRFGSEVYYTITIMAATWFIFLPELNYMLQETVLKL